MHMKIASTEVICCKKLPSITDEVTLEANSVDPEQTAPIGAVLSGSILFSIDDSLTFQQTRKQATFVVIGALWVKISFDPV